MKINYSEKTLKKRKIYNQEYQRKHKEELAAKKREKYLLNREMILQNAKNYRQAHIGKTREANRKYYRNNAQEIREHKRKYNEEHPDNIRETRLKSYDKNAEKRREYARRYNINCPEKRAAHSKVQAALKNGILARKPCQVCGTTENLEAHHEDYSKPYDITWLCQKHHRQFHKIIKGEVS